jgi:invasion protein IalB
VPARSQGLARALVVAMAVTLAVAHGSDADTVVPDSMQPSLPLRLHLSPSSWTKVCRNGGQENAQNVCFTGNHGRTDSGTSFVAVDLIDSGDDTHKILRVTLPLGMRLSDGTWIEVDHDPPIKAPYITCIPLGCVADYEANDALLDKLKQGNELDILAVDGGGQMVSFVLPLLDFDEIYNGPPTGGQAFGD